MKHRIPSRLQLLKILKVGTGLALLSVLPSCAVHENTRQLSPGFSDSGVTGMRTFYVRKTGDDDYKLGETIVTELQQMGYRATTGTAGSPPGKVDAVITYTDKWMWDITMYMISLDVQLREPASDATLAVAKTVRTSLVRKSQKEMVRETLTKLLKSS
jgi:hypothetical protein